VAYDEVLAGRLRERLPGLATKRMFGGLAFLADGNMLVCVAGDDLMVRVGKEATADALAEPGAQPMMMGTRTSAGWVLVDGAALDDDELEKWIGRARAFVDTLPPK
jgi:TfoX/Sxy family transcriptional regulator of competence genes